MVTTGTTPPAKMRALQYDSCGEGAAGLKVLLLILLPIPARLPPPRPVHDACRRPARSAALPPPETLDVNGPRLTEQLSSRPEKCRSIAARPPVNSPSPPCTPQRHKPVLKHVEVPVPTAKKNEVLLKLQAATVNPVDWKIQKGDMRPLLPRRLPFIPVTDVAGEVVDVGPGVKDLAAGDQVVAMLNSLNGGGLAEYVVAPANMTVKRPSAVSAAEGAGIPIAAGSALKSLRSIGAKFDGTSKPLNVLITAASGGVGLYAVQLAKLANLHVTATCGAGNMDLVRSLGADEVMDYKTPEGASLQSPSGKKYDGVVHCTVGVSWSTFRPLLSSRGRVIDLTPNLSAILASGLHKVTFAKKRVVPLFLRLNKADLEFLVGLLEEGKLKTVIDSRFPLSEASKAWQTSIDGHPTGKIVVEMES